MSLSAAEMRQARAEAADWFARLHKHDVPADDMEEFRLWRKLEGRKEAYDEVNALWKRSEALKADPDIQELMAQALKPPFPQPKPRGRRALGIGLAFAAVALTLGAASYTLLGPKTYSTRIGEQRTVRLADGSTMVLDTNTKALVRLASTRRDIQLIHGEAVFEVAHDASRPFVVTAGETSVRALGTKFDVRREAVGATVTLVRGSVEVRQQSQSGPRVWRLAPNQRVDTAAATATPVAVNAASATSWTTGRLEFHGVTLRAAVAEFNRYERRKIEVEDGPWVDDRVSGVFDVSDTPTFVKSVAELNDLTVSDTGKGVIRLSRSGDGVAVP